MKSLNRYNDFILERKLELLFESTIYISDELSEILKSGEIGDHVIAKILRTYTNIDTDTKVNFIDVTDTNDRLSFINDDKGMELYNDGDSAYNSTSRNEVKIGKIVRKLLTSLEKSKIPKSVNSVIKLLNDKDIEEFVNLYKSEHDIQKGMMDRFELVSGDDVKKYYLEENYQRVDGILGNSCMRYTSCQDYLEFYTMNDVKLLILFADDDRKKIIARSIIWENVDISGIGTGTFMDRIYTINDSDTKLFKKYAKNNKWWYKSYQDSDGGTSLYGPDDDYTDDDYYDLVFKVKKGKHKYPYMDTFKFYHYKYGYVSNDEDDYCIELISVDGRYDCDACDGRGESECYDCDGRGQKECYTCDGWGHQNCDECSGEGTEECSDCEGQGYRNCPECDSNDEECEHCGGDTVSCESCNGNGENDCSECDGRGKQDCDDCEGSGDTECSSCEGEGENGCSDCEDYQNH